MRSAISIDLGAAFTKIAFRKEPDDRAELIRHEKLRLDEEHVCIPTIAAWRESDDRWVFGVDAADIKSGEEVHVFRNWKPLLFNPPAEVLDPDSAIGRLFYRSLQMGDNGWQPARIIAVKYFNWLRTEILNSLPGGMNLDEPVVRISVPEFAINGEQADEVERILSDAGWDTPFSFCLPEPLTNLTGALSHGRNRMKQGEDGAPEPDIEHIFSGSELYRFVASTASEEAPGVFTVLLVDIGAYTADFGVVSIDPNNIGNFTLCETHSEPYGIEMLDSLVRHGLPPLKSEVIANLTASERELYRRTVYSEERSWSINNVTIGEGEEAQIVDKCINGISTRIGNEIERFLERHDVESLREVIFTGGGTNIPRIVRSISERIAHRGVRSYHSVLTFDPPGEARCVPLNQQVVRGASALGGASVLFGDV